MGTSSNASYPIRNRHVNETSWPDHHVAVAEYYHNFVADLLTMCFLIFKICGMQATCTWMVSGSYWEIDCYHWNPRIPVQNCSTWCQPAKLTYILYWFTHSIHVTRGVSQTKGIWEGGHCLRPTWRSLKGFFAMFSPTYHSFESNWPCFCPIFNSWNTGDFIYILFWNI